MATVAQLSDPYANFMLGPRRGLNVCTLCFNLTDGYGRCYACAHGGLWLDAMLAISYSVAGEQLHHALAIYKRGSGSVARRFELGLAAVLWRFASEHERCLSGAARVPGFTLVTTVPSSRPGADGPHVLDGIVSSLVGPLQDRYARVLRRTAVEMEPHRFSVEKFACTRDLRGASVLLIDDTWTTGANAQSAAAALKSAGAGAVAALVIGRHVNRGWRNNDRHLRALPLPFDWTRCALCDHPPREPPPPAPPSAAPVMSSQPLGPP